MIENRELVRWYTYVGATGRQLTVNAKTEDGEAYDLTDFASATLSARLAADAVSPAYKISGAAMTISDAANGVLTYTPSSDEIDTEGEMLAQVRLIADAAPDYLEPFIIVVSSAIYSG